MKCKGAKCPYFVAYDDGEGYPCNCRCEITNKWVDVMPEDLDSENELDCSLDDKILGDLQAKDAAITALSSRVGNLVRAKTSAEKVMHYLIDHKMISGWYFNGEFHIEINHEKVV